MILEENNKIIKYILSEFKSDRGDLDFNELKRLYKQNVIRNSSIESLLNDSVKQNWYIEAERELLSNEFNSLRRIQKAGGLLGLESKISPRFR